MSNGFLPIYLNALFCTYHYQKYNVNSTQFDWIRYLIVITLVLFLEPIHKFVARSWCICYIASVIMGS